MDNEIEVKECEWCGAPLIQGHRAHLHNLECVAYWKKQAKILETKNALLQETIVRFREMVKQLIAWMNE